MIAFATAISETEAYERFAAPGIALAAEPDSEVYAFAAVGSISRSLNVLLDAAADQDDLEALIIVRQDTQIAAADICRVVRRQLTDPGVGVAGCMGASGFRGIAWWEGDVSCGPVVHRYYKHGGGEFTGFPWAAADAPLGEVDAVDGCLLALSPWVVRNVRFDETLTPAHGFDVDFCRQVRGEGRKVVTAELAVIRHHSLELVGDPELWVESHIRFAQKWEGADRGDEYWTARARRAEADRDAARTIAYSNALRLDARLAPLERQHDALTGSFSWRLTAPLRRLNQARRGSLVGERPPDRRLRDDRLLGGDARPMAQAREALGD
jgi:Glycosyltransferase like family